jgi:hypothetical protein
MHASSTAALAVRIGTVAAIDLADTGAVSSTQGLATDYLLASRIGDIDRLRRIAVSLSAMRPFDLREDLADDQARLAFWLNLYNGAVLRQPDHPFGSWLERSAFFRRSVLRVAGRPISLDAIEHGLLRRSRWRLSLGFVANPLPSSFERANRVDRLDPRIHFALNCAAASCPPIASYQPEDIDAQLGLATRSYLASEVVVATNHILLPRIFLWFAGDFGGPPGIRALLRAHRIPGSGRPIRFARFDWTPTPGRWVGSSD